MANVKINLSNFDEKLDEWKNNVDTTRNDSLYFLSTELNSSDIQQSAWEKNLLISIANVDNFTSKITFIDVLN